MFKSFAIKLLTCYLKCNPSTSIPKTKLRPSDVQNQDHVTESVNDRIVAVKCKHGRFKNEAEQF